MKSVWLENRPAELFHSGPIHSLEIRDPVYPFKELDLTLPRFLDAQILSLLLAADHWKLPKRMIQIPGHELK
jgi:hypothetical protein